MNWVQRWRKQYEQLNAYADALEKQNKYMAIALANAAGGYAPGGWAGQTAHGISKLAANELVAVGQMTRPERPFRFL